MKPCNQCGKCCINYADGGLSASQADIDWWEIGRPDIYRFVNDNKIWMDPDSGEQLAYCPWLKQLADGKYGCEIYHDRPEDCRLYPVMVGQMIKDECEMLERGDLDRPLAAQRELDRIRLTSVY